MSFSNILNENKNLMYNANLLFNQGYGYFILGCYVKSLSYFQQSLKYYETLYKNKCHSKIADCLNYIGDCLLKLNDYDMVEDYLNRCLEIRKKLPKTTNIELASVYHSLGNYYDIFGNIEKSYEYRQLSYEIRVEFLGEQNRLTANSINNLAICLQKIGNYTESKNLFEKTLQIRINIHNNEPNTEIADSLFNLGVLNELIGNLEKSLMYFQQAYEMRKIIHKDEYHFDVYESYLSLAKVYYSLGNIDQAQSFEQLALNTRQNLSEINRLQEADLLYNMGIIYDKIGQQEKSIELFNQSYTIFKSIFKDKHLIVKHLVKNICFIESNSYFEWNYVQVLEWFQNKNINSDITFYFMSSKIDNDMFANLINLSLTNEKFLHAEIKRQINNVTDSDIDHFIFSLKDLNFLEKI